MRRAATIAAVLGLAAAGAVAGYVIGDDSGGTPTEHAATSPPAQRERSAKAGYREGFRKGLRNSYSRAYDTAYVRAYQQAFADAGLPVPGQVRP